MPPKKATTKPKKAAEKAVPKKKSPSPKMEGTLSLHGDKTPIMAYNLKEKASKPMTVTQVCIHTVRGREKKDGTRGPSRKAYRLAGVDAKTGQAMSLMTNEWEALNLVEYNKQHGVIIPIKKCISKEKPPKKEKAGKPKKTEEKKPRKPKVTKAAKDLVEAVVEEVVEEVKAKPKKVTKPKVTKKAEGEKKTAPKKKVAPKKTKAESEEKPKKKAVGRPKKAEGEKKAAPKKKATPKKKTATK